jgi:predicted nucleic acid-binding protein
VGIKLFVTEELSDAADRLFRRLTNYRPARLYVSDLFFVECANTLWKYVRRFGYPPENARQDVADLRALALITVSTADLLEPALELAMTYDISAYDASYAALSAQLGLPLITADASLAHKLQASGVEVRTLEELARDIDQTGD